MNLNFSKDELYVPLSLVEEKCKKEIDDLNDRLSSTIDLKNNIINDLRKSLELPYTMVIGSRTRDYDFRPFRFINNKTSLVIGGIEIYTGDEVILPNGRLGIITIDESSTYSKYEIMTNHGWFRIEDNSKSPSVHQTIKTNDLKFSRPVQQFKHKEEVAKGRNGGEGLYIFIDPVGETFIHINRLSTIKEVFKEGGGIQ